MLILMQFDVRPHRPRNAGSRADADIESPGRLSECTTDENGRTALACLTAAFAQSNRYRRLLWVSKAGHRTLGSHGWQRNADVTTWYVPMLSSTETIRSFFAHRVAVTGCDGPHKLHARMSQTAVREGGFRVSGPFRRVDFFIKHLEGETVEDVSVTAGRIHCRKSEVIPAADRSVVMDRTSCSPAVGVHATQHQ